MDSVVLSTAFTWLCPKCKRRNYEKGHPVPREEVEAFPEEIEDIDGEFLEAPTTVVCRKCLEKFYSFDPAEEELD